MVHRRERGEGDGREKAGGGGPCEEPALVKDQGRRERGEGWSISSIGWEELETRTRKLPVEEAARVRQ